MSGWWCEASLFCEAPQWLAKQTTDVRLSLWESKLFEGTAENFVTTLRSLSLSVRRCDNQVLFLANESARDRECLHSVRIRSKVLLPWVTAGLLRAAVNRRKNTLLVHLSLNTIQWSVWACVHVGDSTVCVCAHVVQRWWELMKPSRQTWQTCTSVSFFPLPLSLTPSSPAAAECTQTQFQLLFMPSRWLNHPWVKLMQNTHTQGGLYKENTAAGGDK